MLSLHTYSTPPTTTPPPPANPIENQKIGGKGGRKEGQTNISHQMSGCTIPFKTPPIPPPIRLIAQHPLAQHRAVERPVAVQQSRRARGRGSGGRSLRARACWATTARASASALTTGRSYRGGGSIFETVNFPAETP